MINPLQRSDPSKIGPYQLIQRLGEGGQGVVYLAETEERELVAVKVLRLGSNEDPKARKRFRREIELLQSVGSATARLLAADASAERPYHVTEFIPGLSLHEHVQRNGPMTGEALDHFALRTCADLAKIHKVGVVHRDVKPGNILMSSYGPRIIDFGVASQLDVGGAATMTTQRPETRAFLTPEQLSRGKVGPPADVFAWAATITYAATGRTPFGAVDEPDDSLIYQIAHKPPDLRDVPPALRKVLARCLAKKPADRPTAAELLGLLQPTNGAEQPAKSRVQPEAPRSRTPRVVRIAGLAMSVLVLEAGIGWNALAEPEGWYAFASAALVIRGVAGIAYFALRDRRRAYLGAVGGAMFGLGLSLSPAGVLDTSAEPEPTEQASSCARDGTPLGDTAITGKASSVGATVRAAPSLDSERIQQYPKGCGLAFVGYCVGETVMSPAATPDQRWYVLPDGRGVVPAASISEDGAASAGMSPMPCAGGRQAPKSVDVRASRGTVANNVTLLIDAKPNAIMTGAVARRAGGQWELLGTDISGATPLVIDATIPAGWKWGDLFVAICHAEDRPSQAGLLYSFAVDGRVTIKPATRGLRDDDSREAARVACQRP
jgi:Protein kinase domain